MNEFEEVLPALYCFTDTCNTYLRSVPSDEPLVTLGSFLSFFGWALVLTTISVAAFRAEADDGHGEGETGLAETYATVWRVTQLPAVRRLFVVLITCRASFVRDPPPLDFSAGS